MAINVKDPETDRLARELARLTDENLTVAIRRSIEERLARVRARTNATAQVNQLDDLIARGRARATLDPRSADDIIGYDHVGLPR